MYVYMTPQFPSIMVCPCPCICLMSCSRAVGGCPVPLPRLCSLFLFSQWSFLLDPTPLPLPLTHRGFLRHDMCVLVGWLVCSLPSLMTFVLTHTFFFHLSFDTFVAALQNFLSFVVSLQDLKKKKIPSLPIFL